MSVTAVGQTFERVGFAGSVYTVVHVERRYASAFNGPAWYVTLMCLVPPVGAVFDYPGRKFNEVVGPLNLQSYGYTRVG